MHLVYAEPSGHIPGDRFAVAGKHDRFFHALASERRDGLSSPFLDLVCDDDMPKVVLAARDVHHRTGVRASGRFDSKGVHQLLVAGADGLAAKLSGYALSGNFCDIAERASIKFATVMRADRPADGVGGAAFHRGGHPQQLLLGNLVRVDHCYVKGAARQRARFVKNDGFGVGKRLQIVAAFNQNTGLARSADSAKEAERHGNDQRARAADHQEAKRANAPVRPAAAKKDGRNQEQKQRRKAHGGRIDPGKAGDEAFGARLFIARVLHQVKNFSDG